MLFLLDSFVKAGSVTYRIDFLGSGQSSGVLTLDAEKFFKEVISDFLERRKVSFSKIIAIGISFGAYGKTRRMAIDHRIAGGIGISIPVFHQDQWNSLEEGDWLCFHQPSAETTRPIVTKMTLYGVIDQVHSPLLSFLGGKATMNHPESSEILQKPARGPLTLEVFPEGNHGCLGKIRKEILPKAVEQSREIAVTFEDHGMGNRPVKLESNGSSTGFCSRFSRSLNPTRKEASGHWFKGWTKLVGLRNMRFLRIRNGFPAGSPSIDPGSHCFPDLSAEQVFKEKFGAFEKQAEQALLPHAPVSSEPPTTAELVEDSRVSLGYWNLIFDAAVRRLILEFVQNHSIALGIENNSNHGHAATWSRHRLDDDLNAFFPECFHSSAHIVDLECDLPSGAAGRARTIHHCGRGSGCYCIHSRDVAGSVAAREHVWVVRIQRR